MAAANLEGISRVGVVGCGTMGAGIVELIAGHGLGLVFIDVDDDAVARGHERIRASLDRQVRRGRLAADDVVDITQRIDGSSDFQRLADCDLVIEAVPEVLATKQAIFRRIDQVVRPDAILATNTSSLPVMDIAVQSRRPNRVLGFHFFNPAPVMRLIELVRTAVTDDAVVDAARAFAEGIGKVPVVVGDRRGFIANQLLFPYLNQAVWMVEGGYATKEDVDAAMRHGAGLPMGPIALTDMIGVDTVLEVMEAIHAQFDDTRFAPRPLMTQLAMAGYTGRKTGRGFYVYDEPGSSTVVADDDARNPADLTLVDGWQRVGVVGTGEMATGIAEVCAKAGFDVVVRGRSRDRAENVLAQSSLSMQRLVDKGRMSQEELVAALGRMHPTIELDDLADCDLIIEAVTDDTDVKHETFADLGARVRDDAILTSTTSSMPIIECAMASGRPERVLGLHFFKPAAIMRLVEIVTTVRTDPAIVEPVRAFVARLDKIGVLCGDRAGYIVNTLLFPYLNDAVKLLETHYATAEEIDTAMRLGCGYPMGPFELMDVVGLDTTLSIIQRLHSEYRQRSHEPAELLRHLVDAGFLGRKTGRGFYVYD